MRGTFGNIRLHNAPGVEQEGPYTTYPARRARRCSCTTPRCATEARRRAAHRPRRQASTAAAPRATGRPRAPRSSASAPSSPRAFERIHRSNLVGMGVLPLQFPPGETAGVAGADRTGALRHRRPGRRRSAPRASVEVRVAPTERPSANHQGHRPARRPGRGRLLPPGRGILPASAPAGWRRRTDRRSRPGRPAARRSQPRRRYSVGEVDALRRDRMEDRVEEAVSSPW